ncbi:MAG TPA: DUF4394 domain-containing protein [Noviherbaspirillum sp.]|jgi:outer membrane protein assembly factor BamB|uniref:DUF4394 domain-containing protein n=1 Tax=Noviherbaspirillum sp. TaxID=1926288 RepID=UPI002F9334EB
MSSNYLSASVRIARPLIALSMLGALAACASFKTAENTPRRETVYAVTASNQLVSFNAGQPKKLLTQARLSGLEAGDAVAGIDFRVARGKLYLVTRSARVYLVDPATGRASQVGSGTPGAPLPGTDFGIDFNPTVDRIRVVSNAGANLRLHPDTGAMVDGDLAAPGVQGDGKLAYAAGDPNAGQTPALVAAAYTYNKQDEKLTTNFAIDAARGTLVTQGSREGATPVVSPNTGQLYTVGKLEVPPFQRASFDIADVSGAAYAATVGTGGTLWYQVDLSTGKAALLGTIGNGEPVTGIAIEP